MLKDKPLVAMTLISLALWVVILFPLLAEVTINKPLMQLVDSNGVVVATSSTSIEKAMEKASKLGSGVYTLQRPDVTITVTSNTPQTEVTISWIAPTENTDNTPLTDLTGYKVYYGLSSDNLTGVLVDNSTSKKISGLSRDTYYFAVSAVNALGVESELSNVVSKVVM